MDAVMHISLVAFLICTTLLVMFLKVCLFHAVAVQQSFFASVKQLWKPFCEEPLSTIFGFWIVFSVLLPNKELATDG